MSNEIATSKQFFAQENVQAKFKELLGNRAPQFITSVLQIVNSNQLLSKASPATVYNAAATAATMDLPINQNLGFAYIVPYKGQAQFQMGWKGFVQLAQRSGQFKTIHTTEIYESQIEHVDYMTGEVKLNNTAPSGKVVGFMAYFRLLNGFEKSLYMTAEQMAKHAKKYSQSYQRGSGVWADGEDGFNAMAKKTVLKLLLSRFAPMSIEMQKAVVVDQAIINDADAVDVTYIDNTIDEQPSQADKEAERALLLAQDALSKCKTMEEVQAVANDFPDVDQSIFVNFKLPTNDSKRK